jgi:hypothetical protein
MGGIGANSETMLSAPLMLRRVARALRYAEREEDFLTVLGAGVMLRDHRKRRLLAGRGVECRRRALVSGSHADDDERRRSRARARAPLDRLDLAFVAVRAQERAAKATRTNERERR